VMRSRRCRDRRANPSTTDTGLRDQRVPQSRRTNQQKSPAQNSETVWHRTGAEEQRGRHRAGVERVFVATALTWTLDRTAARSNTPSTIRASPARLRCGASRGRHRDDLWVALDLLESDADRARLGTRQARPRPAPGPSSGKPSHTSVVRRLNVWLSVSRGVPTGGGRPHGALVYAPLPGGLADGTA
jgi:hypothetical protein